MDLNNAVLMELVTIKGVMHSKIPEFFFFSFKKYLHFLFKIIMCIYAIKMQK